MSQVRAGAAFVELTLKNSALVKGLRSAQKQLSSFAASTSIMGAKPYAAILDNNYPGRFELTPREQFVRLWAGYGGFALTVMHDPASSLPYRSYEVIE